jgi:hypothetical protein
MSGQLERREMKCSFNFSNGLDHYNLVSNLLSLIIFLSTFFLLINSSMMFLLLFILFFQQVFLLVLQAYESEGISRWFLLVLNLRAQRFEVMDSIRDSKKDYVEHQGIMEGASRELKI